ncbi:Uncharacterised protein [Nocardia otitidiscaviarum]|uniref:Uncharacterized protein n=1 Tax=Nocardia otitidiscaviarum TaxID=1823 RepID=A0A379JM13_9NOCA|nr:hypothetical protein [Nocardia otitidiscaviarum]SUD49545.1 Uncharacterised protein [Nocardia otitidiscaviarum]
MALGYLRLDLVADRRADVERLMQDAATRDGVGTVHFFRERASESEELRSLLRELRAAGGSHVYVPTTAHLDGHPLPRRTLLYRLWEMKAQVWYLDPAENSLVSRGRAGRGLSPLPTGSEVVSFRCTATISAHGVVQLRVHEVLTRVGLRAMVEPVESVVLAVVDEAIEAQRTDTPIYTQLAPEPAELTVRLSLWPAELMVEIHEARTTDAAVPAVLEELGRADRVRVDGGMLTRCSMGLPTALGTAVLTGATELRPHQAARR